MSRDCLAAPCDGCPISLIQESQRGLAAEAVASHEQLGYVAAYAAYNSRKGISDLVEESTQASLEYGGSYLSGVVIGAVALKAAVKC